MLTRLLPPALVVLMLFAGAGPALADQDIVVGAARVQTWNVQQGGECGDTSNDARGRHAEASVSLPADERLFARVHRSCGHYDDGTWSTSHQSMDVSAGRTTGNYGQGPVVGFTAGDHAQGMDGSMIRHCYSALYLSGVVIALGCPPPGFWDATRLPMLP